MKLIITEDKIYNVFVKYMDSQYNLSYNYRTREFIDKYDDVFGWMDNESFLYGQLSDEEKLSNMFGDNVNKLLLPYLRDTFPSLTIFHIL